MMVSASREKTVPVFPTASALRGATEQRRLGGALEMGAPRTPWAVPVLHHPHKKKKKDRYIYIYFFFYK